MNVVPTIDQKAQMLADCQFVKENYKPGMVACRDLPNMEAEVLPRNLAGHVRALLDVIEWLYREPEEIQVEKEYQYKMCQQLIDNCKEARKEPYSI